VALKGRAAAAAFLFSIIASSISRGSGRVSLPERSDKAQSRQQLKKKKKKKEKMRHVSAETMYKPVSLIRSHTPKIERRERKR
jgi:hypothetical protein